MPAVETFPFDTSGLPHFFTRMPVRIRADYEEIYKGTMEIVNRVTPDKSAKAYKHAMYRHSAGPKECLSALTSGPGQFHRVMLGVEFYEVFWTHDDDMEHCTLEVAMFENKRLRHALYNETNDPTQGPGTSPLFDHRLEVARDLFRKFKAEDPVFYEELREITDEYLTKEEQFEANTGSLEEYLKFRVVHIGNKFICGILRWEAGIEFNEAERAMTEEYTEAVGVYFALSNDLLSFRCEDEGKGRVINSIIVLRKLHNIPEKAAFEMLTGVLVNHETKMFEMIDRILKRPDVTPAVAAYIEAMKWYCGGIFTWTMMSPRYTRPQIL